MPRQINLIPTGNYALAKNVDRVKTIGWEADLHYRDSIGNGRLLAQLGILWLDNQAPNGGAGIYLNSHARFLMNGLVEYRIGKWSGSIGGLYKKRSAQTSSPLSTTLTPSYFLMNIKLVYTGRENRFAPYLQADNLFNTRYSDLLGAPMPGRWLSGGFQVTL
jgi:iron complex outermembrane receptor protein